MPYSADLLPFIKTLPFASPVASQNLQTKISFFPFKAAVIMPERVHSVLLIRFKLFTVSARTILRRSQAASLLTSVQGSERKRQFFLKCRAFIKTCYNRPDTVNFCMQVLIDYTRQKSRERKQRLSVNSASLVWI